MRKNKIVLSGLMMLLGIGLVGCDDGFKGLINNGGTTGEGNENTDTLTGNEKFTMQAVTSLKLASGINTSSLAKGRISDTEVANIQEMLPQLDMMLNNGTSYETTITQVDTVINGTTYAYQETITFKDVNLVDTTYTLIYNMNQREFKEDWDETEIITTINGVATFDNTTYLPFSSYSVEENEDKEKEIERNLRITLNNNSSVYVEESFEEEGNEVENEFEYTLINNGRRELNYSIEIEKEGFKDSIEYELNNKEYEITRINDIYYIKVKEGRGFVDYVKFQKVIDQTTGLVTYNLVA